MSKVKIESEDSNPRNCKITIDGENIDFVQAVQIDMQIDRIITAHFILCGVSLSVISEIGRVGIDKKDYLNEKLKPFGYVVVHESLLEKK